MITEPFTDERTALAWVRMISAIAIVLPTAERLSAPGNWREGGVFAWLPVQASSKWLARRPVRQVAGAVFRYPRVLWILSARVVAAMVVLATAVRWPAVCDWMVVAVAALSVLLTVHMRLGRDGSDQMSQIVFVAMSITVLWRSPAAVRLCLWFVAGQACLSHATAGLAKAVAPGWRDGSHLIAILGSRHYGNPSLAAVLRAHPAVATWAARSTILLECLFPLVLVVGSPWVYAFLVAGVCFHVGVALSMGLGNFVWAFMGRYPAILYVGAAHSPW